jgi:hypothetical protein
MNRYVRYALVIAGSLALIPMVGFFFQQTWATNLLPWTGSRLSNIFIASIFAASAIPVIWIGASGELGTMVGGAIDFGLTYAGIGVFSLQLYTQDTGRVPVLVFGIVSFAALVLCLVLFLWSRHIPFGDQRPTPRWVTLSFAAFAAVLIVVGGALTLQVPNIFPWVLSSELSVVYGWIFLGAACYFIYGLVNPKWSNAKGQLLGFLAYDIVLIGPFIGHFATVRPDLLLNLTAYVAVLLYSGVLAIYYLFINKATRILMQPQRL